MSKRTPATVLLSCRPAGAGASGRTAAPPARPPNIVIILMKAADAHRRTVVPAKPLFDELLPARHP
jgi:hypothetical protein